jgi:DNA invertase Pin-like site-specific DNA recombinase
MNTGKKQRLANPPILVGVYARISEDKDDESKNNPDEFSAGVKRQEKDGRALAKARNWTVHKVYVDDDLSAYKRNVFREQFWQMLADLKAGIIQGIVAYDIDRFTRQPKELEAAIDLYEADQNLVFATVTNDLNLATADGRTFARLLVTMANKSSYDTSRRVGRKHLELAEMGRPVGSRFRPFGWEKNKVDLHPVEGPVARQIIMKYLAGHKGGTIVKWLRAENVNHTSGGPWTTAALRAWLRMPRLAGWRGYKNFPIMVNGKPVESNAPLCSPQEWERIQARLDGNAAAVAHLDFSRKHLCSGRMRCVCSCKMSGGRADYKGQDTSSYKCPPGSGKRFNCGSNYIHLTRTDQLISELVFTRLTRSDEKFDQHIATAWPGEADLARLQEQKTELMAAYRSGALSAAVVFPEISKVEQESEVLIKQRKAWARNDATAVNRDHMKDVLEHWDDPDYYDQKRELVQSEIEVIIVQKAASRNARWNPERLEVVWFANAG